MSRVFPVSWISPTPFQLSPLFIPQDSDFCGLFKLKKALPQCFRHESCASCTIYILLLTQLTCIVVQRIDFEACLWKTTHNCAYSAIVLAYRRLGWKIYLNRFQLVETHNQDKWKNKKMKIGSFFKKNEMKNCYGLIDIRIN